jgi:hypothetical protein
MQAMLTAARRLPEPAAALYASRSPAAVIPLGRRRHISLRARDGTPALAQRRRGTAVTTGDTVVVPPGQRATATIQTLSPRR